MRTFFKCETCGNEFALWTDVIPYDFFNRPVDMCHKSTYICCACAKKISEGYKRFMENLT